MRNYHALFLGAGRLAEFFFQAHDPSGWGRIRRTPGPLINICGDLRTLPVASWPPVHTVVIALTPQRSSTESYCELYEQLIPKLLEQLRYQRVIFISSTRVYHPTQPSVWVDEQSPLSCNDRAAVALLNAERAVRAHSFNNFAIIRPSGLYDTSRPPPASWAENHCWANRVHYTDLARLLDLIVQNTSAGQLIVNASDDTPFIPAHYAGNFNEWRPAITHQSQRPARDLKISNLLSRSLGFSYTYPSILAAYTQNSQFIITS